MDLHAFGSGPCANGGEKIDSAILYTDTDLERGYENTLFLLLMLLLQTTDEAVCVVA